MPAKIPSREYSGYIGKTNEKRWEELKKCMDDKYIEDKKITCALDLQGPQAWEVGK